MAEVTRSSPPEPAAPPSPNGHVSDPFEAKLLADLDGAIREKRDAVIGLESERAKLDERLAVARAAAKRYEDTRRRLVGEPLRVAGRGAGRPKGPAKRAVPSKVAPDTMAEIEAFVRAWAEDHEEFRQIDIRSAPGSPVTDSGKSSAAFEQMRQANVLRLARVDGNNKFYRLTRSAVTEQ